MNNEKAREFFSQYYDGSLDGGLRQSLEQRMAADSVLASDYAAFSETMVELESMRFEEIEVPSYLSDRIATRLDAITEQKPRFSLFSFNFLRGSAIAGIAAAGMFIVWQATTTNSAGDRNLAIGSVTQFPAVNADQLKFDYKDGSVVMNFRPSTPKTIIVSSGTTGAEIQRFHLNGELLSSPLKNDLAGTSLFDVQVEGEPDHATVAVPGTARTGSAQGTGNVKDYAAALADYYRVPVLLQAQNVQVPLSWNFTATDPRAEATETLGNLGYSVDLRPSGMIVLLDR